MCYPSRCPRRSVSCHGGGVCCPRPCCRERSRSTCSPRVIFPGEFQKFSDMIPPSFLLKQPPKCEKVKKKSNCTCQAANREKGSDCGDKGHEDNCVEMTGVPGNPWCGTNGPWENTMTINWPLQPQCVCFECPPDICTPKNPPGVPAAGMPTKRSPPFNPCTGQVYQCENRQLMVGNNTKTAQCPTCGQFCQCVNIRLSPANPCYQFNPSNFGGVEMGCGNVAKATETRRSINSSQRHQYDQRGYGDGTNSYEAKRNQPYFQVCQGINMCPGSANPCYLYDGGDGTSPQDDNRSKCQRKGKETRGGNVGNAAKSRKSPIAGQRQNNQNNCTSQGGKRSTSQGTRNESRESPRANQHNRSNSQNPRKESMGQAQNAETSGCPNSYWSCRYGPCSCPCNNPCSGTCNSPSGTAAGPCNTPWNGSCNCPCGGPCGSPYHGRFYYCGNCCNSCRQCCNYRCNPCGGYCCSQPPVSQVKSGKASTKSKEKPAGGKGTPKRNQGGASGSHCIAPPSPTFGFPGQSPSTMPGYYPTRPPQCISPYSGHWQASEVVYNPMFSKQYP